MKYLYTFLFFISLSFINAQVHFCDESAHSNEMQKEIVEYFSNIRIDEGKLFLKNGLKDVGGEIPTEESGCTTIDGLFQLHYLSADELSLDQCMQDVICQVFNDLDVLIEDQVDVPIQISILPSSNAAIGGVLGVATSFFDLPNAQDIVTPTGGGYYSDVQWAIHNPNGNNPEFLDANIALNMEINLLCDYEKCSTPETPGYDLYTVVLHEALHLLGFSSSRTINSPGYLFTLYDTKLEYFSGAPPMDLTLSNFQLNPSFYGNIPPIPNNCISGIRIGNSLNQSTYSTVFTTPNVATTTRFSHLDASCGYPYVMRTFLTPYETINISLEEIGVLSTLDYALSCEYGMVNLLNSSIPNSRYFEIPNCDLDEAMVEETVLVDDYKYNFYNPNYSLKIYSSECADEPGVLEIYEKDLIFNDINVSEIDQLFDDQNNVMTEVSGTVAPDRVYRFTCNTSSNAAVLTYTALDMNYNGTEQVACVTISIIECPEVLSPFNEFPPECVLVGNPEINLFWCNDDLDDCEIELVNNNTLKNCDYVMENGFANGMLLAFTTQTNHWYNLIGTPSYNDDNCINGVSLPNPTSTSGGALQLYSADGIVEAVMTPLSFGGFQIHDDKIPLIEKDENYLFSYKRAADDINGIDVNLTNWEDVWTTELWFSHFRNPVKEDVGYQEFIPLGLQTILSDNITSAGIWEQKVGCFNADQDFDLLYFETNGSGMSSLPNIYIDEVEILKDDFLNYGNNIINTCSNNAILGQDFCDLDGTEYAWYDITEDVNNPIQLTSGLGIIGSNSSPVVVNSVNFDGKQISVQGLSSTTILRLVRIIPNATSCSASIDYTINSLSDQGIQIGPIEVAHGDGLNNIGVERRYVSSISHDDEGNFYIAGYFHTGGINLNGFEYGAMGVNNNSAFVAKYNQCMELEWFTPVSPVHPQVPPSIEFKQGQIYMTGNVEYYSVSSNLEVNGVPMPFGNSTTNAYVSDPFVLKLNAMSGTSTLADFKTYDGLPNFVFRDIAVDPSNSRFYIIGAQASSGENIIIADSENLPQNGNPSAFFNFQSGDFNAQTNLCFSDSRLFYNIGEEIGQMNLNLLARSWFIGNSSYSSLDNNDVRYDVALIGTDVLCANTPELNLYNLNGIPNTIGIAPFGLSGTHISSLDADDNFCHINTKEKILSVDAGFGLEWSHDFSNNLDPLSPHYNLAAIDAVNGEVYLSTFVRGEVDFQNTSISNSFYPTVNDMAVVYKLNANGSLANKTDVSEESEEGLNLPSIFDVYPNPSNGIINVSFDLANESNISLRVFDVLGKEVFNTSFQKVSKDVRSVDLSSLTEGMYAVSLDFGEKIQIEKILIRK